MKNKSLRGITFSSRVKVVPVVTVPEGNSLAVAAVDGKRRGVSILLLHYCGIPGIG